MWRATHATHPIFGILKFESSLADIFVIYFGILAEDIIVDPLTLTMRSDHTAGLTCPITNSLAAEVSIAIKAADLSTSRDEYGMVWIQADRKRQKEQSED